MRVARRSSHGSLQPKAPSTSRTGSTPRSRAIRPLYTPEERIRRDRSRWTAVQGVLAALQFLVFIASLVLVLRTLATGEGLALASGSVVLKTLTLYAIMITGALWEHDVYGKYLFAEPFFWEDVVSMGVIALHTAYLAAWWSDALAPRPLMLLALAAYATYAINAAQFLAKFRRARADRKADGATNSDAPSVPPIGTLQPEAAR
jgi:3-vinyl bacteriochlorophyllide hydratase